MRSRSVMIMTKHEKNVSIGYECPRFQLKKTGYKFSAEKVVKSEIEFRLPFMIPYCVFKFQMICLRRIKLLNRNQMQDGRMWTYIRTYKQGLNLMPSDGGIQI
jgi:hypothetical protein